MAPAEKPRQQHAYGWKKQILPVRVGQAEVKLPCFWNRTALSSPEGNADDRASLRGTPFAFPVRPLRPLGNVHEHQLSKVWVSQSQAGTTKV
jgi:hypothetical protein